MKILVMLPSLDAGGAENYALRLIRHAGSKEYSWTVMYPQYGSGDLYKDFVDAGAAMKEMRLGFFDLPMLVEFRRYLASAVYDLVCSFNGVFAGPPLALARLAGIPNRVAWHRRSTPAYRATLARRAYSWIAIRLVERYSTRILSNSSAALDNFHGSDWAADKRFEVIPNGVDAERFRPGVIDRHQARERLALPADGLIIGHVGRFDPAKNHETIFSVIQEISKTRSDLVFLFCGKGTDSPEFIQRLRKNDIEAFCMTLGVRSDLSTVYSSLDAFYFPSWTEGQPNALIEAMLSGVPFVASDIPGIRASVPPWTEGWLVAPGDIKGAVQRLVDSLGQDAAERQAVRNWASQTFDLQGNLGRAMSAMLLNSAEGSRDA